MQEFTRCTGIASASHWACGSPMTLGNAAATLVRLIVWRRDCGHQVEPGPAEVAARVWRERLVCSKQQASGRFVVSGPSGEREQWPLCYTWNMRAYRLFSLALDGLDCLITSTRLRVLDWVWGPEPLTPADERRERERDQLRKAFPKVDIDGQHN
jgi:hypothetical protein